MVRTPPAIITNMSPKLSRCGVFLMIPHTAKRPPRTNTTPQRTAGIAEPEYWDEELGGAKTENSPEATKPKKASEVMIFTDLLDSDVRLFVIDLLPSLGVISGRPCVVVDHRLPHLALKGHQIACLVGVMGSRGLCPLGRCSVF